LRYSEDVARGCVQLSGTLFQYSADPGHSQAGSTATPANVAACSKPDAAAYVGQLGLGALNFAIGSDDYLSEKVREYRLSIDSSTLAWISGCW
jgi:hypothetical protein